MAVDTLSICARAPPSPRAILRSRFVVERALELGARDGERSAQIVGDIVADALELVEQARDFVEHQVDGAGYSVDVVALVGDRQTRIEIAIHDADDGIVNALETVRGAAREKRADRQDRQNRRQEGEGQRAQQRSCMS